MFGKIKKLLTGFTTDIKSTFITLFIIGIMFSGLMVWLGGDENAPKFKKSLLVCCIGLIVFLIASPIVSYFKTKLA
ncbi:TrbC/VirB2 family protein [Heyndrickxia sporothermodurans]|uniref:TrbC/VirB2 family protein n=1 Tax=Heyndrickxia sporothermodurans TaxID=46224 RepID=UPI002DBBAEA1|nr:TrbC/VirB2 family protein [Heyndrickxia sporothermodurans]MEB6550206.1 TrbC/VirB2 family protein [Heyndrickxia sporothermodurans]